MSVSGEEEYLDVRHVTVDDLEKARVSIVADDIKRKGLDTRPAHDGPLHVLLLQLCIRCVLGLFGDGTNRRGTIDGFFGASHVGQPWSGIVLALGSSKSVGRVMHSYCFWAHLNILAI